MSRFAVVIPTLNEAATISATIASLAHQLDGNLQPWPPDAVEIVLVDTPGDDDTPGVARAAAAEHRGVNLTIVTCTERSMVAARRTGFEHLMHRPAGPPTYLVSADADTVFPMTWLYGLARIGDAGAELISAGGFFEPAFWVRCPNLTRRYANTVGTVFFPAQVAIAHAAGGPYTFTPQVFADFGRIPQDAGFALTPAAYRMLGGILEERHSDGSEILDVGWPLYARAERVRLPVGYLPYPEFSTSARRLLHEAADLIAGQSYLGEVNSYRTTTDAQYTALEAHADTLDMDALTRYVIKDYILTPCILRPARIAANPSYFGAAAEDLTRQITAWQDRHPAPGTAQLNAFSELLAERFAAEILTACQQDAATRWNTRPVGRRG